MDIDSMAMKKESRPARKRPGKLPGLYVEVSEAFMIAFEHYCTDQRSNKKEMVLKAIRALPGMADYLKKEDA